jgi:hypothetical protein
MPRPTVDAKFDPLPMPNMAGFQASARYDAMPNLADVDTRLLDVDSFLAKTVQAPPDLGAEFRKGANPTDYSEPGKSDLEQLIYMLGDFTGGVAAEPSGALGGGAAGTVMPGLGNIAGAAIGAEASNQSYNFLSGRRAEYLRELAAKEKPDTNKQDSAGTVQQLSSLIPFSDDVRRGVGVAGKAGKMALNALKQGALSGGTSALTDLLTTGKVDPTKTITNAVTGASVKTGADGLALSGDKLANAGRAAAKWLTTNDAPKGPGFGSTGYPSKPAFTMDGNGNPEFTEDPHTATELKEFNDIFAPYRKDYTNGVVRPAGYLRDLETGARTEKTDPIDKIKGEEMVTDARAAVSDLIDKNGFEKTAQSMGEYMQNLPSDFDPHDRMFADNAAAFLKTIQEQTGQPHSSVANAFNPAENQKTYSAQDMSIWKLSVHNLHDAEGVMDYTMNKNQTEEGVIDSIGGSAAEFVHSGEQSGETVLKDKLRKFLKNSPLPQERKGDIQPLIDAIRANMKQGQPYGPQDVESALRQGLHKILWSKAEEAQLRKLFRMKADAKSPKHALRAQALIDQMIGSRQPFDFWKFAGQNARLNWVMNMATQLGNAASQYTYATYQAMGDVTRVAIDMAASQARKNQGVVRPRQYYMGNTKNKEAQAMVAKQFPSVKDEFHNMWFDAKYGTDTRGVKDATGYYNRGGLTSHKYLGIPYRFHNLVSGLIDRPIALAFATKRYGHRLQGLIEAGQLTPESAQEAYAQSILDAQTIIFQNQSATGQAASGINKSIGQFASLWAPGGVGKFVQTTTELAVDPFVKTNINIFESVVRQSPIGFAQLAWHVGPKTPNTLAARASLVEALAEPINGTLTTLVLLGLAYNGAITRQYDPNKKPIADAARDIGIRDNTINLSATARVILSGNPFSPQGKPQPGDDLQTLDQLSPLKQKLLAAQGIIEALDSGNVGETIALNWGEALSADQTRSGLISRFNRANTYIDPETGERNLQVGLALEFSKSAVGLFQAPLLDQMARLLDSTPPDMNSGSFGHQVLNSYTARIPFLRNTIPNQQDTYGKDRQNDTPPWWFGHNTRLPVANFKPFEQEMLRLGKINNSSTIPKPYYRREKVVVDGIVQKEADGSDQTYHLDDNQRRQAFAIQGQEFKAAGARFMKMPIFKALSDSQRSQIGAQILADARRTGYIYSGIKEPQLITQSGKLGGIEPILMHNNPELYDNMVVIGKYLTKALKQPMRDQKKAVVGKANSVLGKLIVPKDTKVK